ncbi:hypothetical protein GCM10023166_08290 [Paeniglutamicibacter cryotolerans]
MVVTPNNEAADHPGLGPVAGMVRAIQGDPFDLFALGVSEFRRASSGVVGMQGLEAVVVEVVQDVADRRRGW